MAGDVMLSGRLDGSAASRSENIRPDEIDTEYAVVWTINDLNPCNEKRHPIDFRQLWESVNVDRESLERWWAGLFYGTSDVARDSNRSKKGGAKSAAISMAIGAEFPNGIPSGIAAKERNARIQKRLILLGVSSPVSDEALAKGVQRYLQIDN